MGIRFAAVTGMLLLAGCHAAAPPSVATEQDVAAKQDEATREVSEARAEASKGVKSAAKVSGSDSKVVIDAKITGNFDVAMAKADGDHKVAAEKCLTMPPDQQAGCSSQADADYDAATAAAKATRLAKRQ